MKRIREFKLTLRSEDGLVANHRISGWHKAWELAEQAMQDRCAEGRIYDAQLKHSPTIAIFSDRNLQNELVDQGTTSSRLSWRSEPLGVIRGFDRYANRNVTDFGWSWVEGAKHDLPFRLSYLERGAERNPNGLWAHLLALRAEFRDLLGRSG